MEKTIVNIVMHISGTMNYKKKIYGEYAETKKKTKWWHNKIVVKKQQKINCKYFLYI